MKKFIIIIFCLTVGCGGYQPIYMGKNNNDISFKTVSLSGDKNINKKIVSSLNIKEKKSIDTLNEIVIKSSKSVEETSKNSKGQTESFRTIIMLTLEIKENNTIIKSKNFNENFSYNNMDNKYNLSIYQNEVENNLVNKIIEELILYLNL